MPDMGIGWYHPNANHIGLINFSVDADPVAPFGTGDDKTNFDPITAGVAQVGDHAPDTSIWTPDHSGTFQINYLGYNARNQNTASPTERGRVTQLVLKHDGVELDRQAISGGLDDGYADR